LAALKRVSNGAAAEMLELAEAEYASSRVRNLTVAEPGATWQNALHLYRATGDSSYLQAAIKGGSAGWERGRALPAALRSHGAADESRRGRTEVGPW
jgi:hypothetical protein